MYGSTQKAGRMARERQCSMPRLKTTISKRLPLRFIILIIAMLVALQSAAGGGGGEASVRGALLLPSTPWQVTIDGDAREALLFGAMRLQAYEATTGNPDGSVRCFMMATQDGLYAALLSTMQPPETALKRFGWKSPQDALMGDWMGLRVASPRRLLFVLTPGGGAATLDDAGLPANVAVSSWAGMDKRYGHTWSGEWLIPWELLGVKPGGSFSAALLRGKKMDAGWSLLESLSTTAPGISACRFGNEPDLFTVPPVAEPQLAVARPLAPFDARPFIPAKEGASVCEDAVPAGEVATAWIEAEPGHEPLRISAVGAPAPVEFFRVDFWWQAGTRDEQDALFPARVAAGAGDVLVAERLFPLPDGKLAASGEPERIYARMRIPREAAPGLVKVMLKLEAGGRSREIPWEISVAPALPAPARLAGIYYLERDRAKWQVDLEDIASHGFNAVTCPAEDQEGWALFNKMAAKAGLDGGYALRPWKINPKPGEAWGYAADEPASAEAVGAMADRAARLRAMGFKPWAALCWPSSLARATTLDAAAGTPAFWRCAEGEALPRTRWIYFQGLRENPSYNRLLAGQASRGPGISGFWIFCYTPEKAEGGDWSQKIIRYDACKAPGEGGLRLDTVEWEAQREGILDGRLAGALGAEADASFPALDAARNGRYWEVPAGFSFESYRQNLVAAWAKKHSP